MDEVVIILSRCLATTMAALGAPMAAMWIADRVISRASPWHAVIGLSAWAAIVCLCMPFFWSLPL